MKYLVLFVASDVALPIDMLGRRNTGSNGARARSRIEQLLQQIEPDARTDLDCESIDGYTTIDVSSHDDAIAVAQSWKWCGGVKVLPLMDAAS